MVNSDKEEILFLKMEDVSLKIYLKDPTGTIKEEVRRFVLSKTVSTSFTDIKQKLFVVIPKLEEKTFDITWTDNDGDNVTIDSDEELVLALNEMSGPLYKLAVIIRDDKKIEETEENSRSYSCTNCSSRVTCDGCQKPIVLCNVCELTAKHPEHKRIIISTEMVNHDSAAALYHSCTKEPDQTKECERRWVGRMTGRPGLWCDGSPVHTDGSLHIDHACCAAKTTTTTIQPPHIEQQQQAVPKIPPKPNTHVVSPRYVSCANSVHVSSTDTTSNSISTVNTSPASHAPATEANFATDDKTHIKNSDNISSITVTTSTENAGYKAPIEPAGGANTTNAVHAAYAAYTKATHDAHAAHAAYTNATHAAQTAHALYNNASQVVHAAHATYCDAARAANVRTVHDNHLNTTHAVYAAHVDATNAAHAAYAAYNNAAKASQIAPNPHNVFAETKHSSHISTTDNGVGYSTHPAPVKQSNSTYSSYADVINAANAYYSAYNNASRAANAAHAAYSNAVQNTNAVPTVQNNSAYPAFTANSNVTHAVHTAQGAPPAYPAPPAYTEYADAAQASSGATCKGCPSPCCPPCTYCG